MQRSRFLDVLRLIALIMMVANHLGVIAADRGVTPTWLQHVVTELGSHAPVVFFFCTGMGYGLKGPVTWTSASIKALLLKVVLLLLADQFLRAWQGQAFWGLDFLAFIGVSMLVVGVLSYQRRGVMMALALMAFALGLRYVFQKPAGFCEVGTCGALNWLLGKHPIHNISYPFSPWIAYPLIGFIAGRWLHSPPAFTQSRVTWRVAVAGSVVLWAALMVAVVVRDMAMFRWATVTFGYFWVSLGILAGAVILAWILQRWRGVPGIEGLPSLLAVPVHYVFLRLHTRWLDADANHWWWLALVTLVTVLVSIAWSRGIEKLATVTGLHAWAWTLLSLPPLAAMMKGVAPTAPLTSALYTLAAVSVVALAMTARTSLTKGLSKSGP